MIIAIEGLERYWYRYDLRAVIAFVVYDPSLL